jgi:hypothetical protein
MASRTVARSIGGIRVIHWYIRNEKGSPDMKSSIPRRGAQDIRTMTEHISDVDNPQRKYLALAMLELEKARRLKENGPGGGRGAHY